MLTESANEKINEFINIKVKSTNLVSCCAFGRAGRSLLVSWLQDKMTISMTRTNIPYHANDDLNISETILIHLDVILRRKQDRRGRRKNCRKKTEESGKRRRRFFFRWRRRGQPQVSCLDQKPTLERERLRTKSSLENGLIQSHSGVLGRLFFIQIFFSSSEPLRYASLAANNAVNVLPHDVDMFGSSNGKKLCSEKVRWQRNVVIYVFLFYFADTFIQSLIAALNACLRACLRACLSRSSQLALTEFGYMIIFRSEWYFSSVELTRIYTKDKTIYFSIYFFSSSLPSLVQPTSVWFAFFSAFGWRERRAKWCQKAKEYTIW